MSIIETNLITAILISCLYVASLMDLKTHRVPNDLIVTALLSCFLSRYIFGGPVSLVEGVFGGALGLLLYYPLWKVNIFGAGDVKLLAVVGTCLGTELCLKISLVTILIGGGYALLVLLYQSTLKSFVKDLFFTSLLGIAKQADRDDWMSLGKTKSPFAPVMAISAITVYLGWI